MLIIIAYDVCTETHEGKARLRRVAKECVNYGKRVQNSVFECKLDNTQYRIIKNKLECIINKSTDSLRFYNLGNAYETKIEYMGNNKGYDFEAPIIL